MNALIWLQEECSLPEIFNQFFPDSKNAFGYVVGILDQFVLALTSITLMYGNHAIVYLSLAIHTAHDDSNTRDRIFAVE